jgi:hypothetical protein
MAVLTTPDGSEIFAPESEPKGQVRIMPTREVRRVHVFILQSPASQHGGNLRCVPGNGLRRATEWPPEVIAFCKTRDIEQEARIALNLVKKHLSPEKVAMQLSSDPEGDSEWLVIRADVRGSAGKVLQDYSACKKEWLAKTPERVWGSIRFLYNIL